MAATKRKSAARTVDTLAACKDSATDENGVVWNFMLNYTDISYGSYGNNKFYMVQLIQDGNNFKVFRKWGRVGAVSPQCALESYNTSLEKAQQSFQKKFLDKSGNEWPLEGPFEKVSGKYVLVELDDQEPDDGEDELDGAGEHDEKDAVPSTLSEEVQDVLKLICDADLIAEEMEKMKIDLKQLPLGRLSKAQISQGYSLLQKLSNALTEIDELQKQDARGTDESVRATNKAATRRSARPKRTSTANASKIRKLKTELKQLSSEFYTLIPHDFGRSLPPAIDTMAEVKLKIDLLEVLSDVEISQKLQREKRKSQQDSNGTKVNPLDAQYNMLDVQMEPLAASEEEFQIIDRYVKTTHAPTHVQYKLKIKSILKIARPSEDAFQKEFQAVSNHKLLWHGSRLSNVVGILSKGLRIAPPEAPSNGYMFGKGIYFADSVSKSANYCWTTAEQPKGVLILAEVALGTPYEALEAEDLSYDSLKSSRSCDSTHGLGRMAPPEEHHETMNGGVVVPIGEFEPTEANGELLYNEYVVYRQEQVKLRYIVALDFEYDV
ncbi:poly polymerase catalytic domain containing protein [Globisporangium polare]